jgi:hypothetical protein
MVGIAGILLSTLLFMAWLLLQAFLLPAREFSRNPSLRKDVQSSNLLHTEPSGPLSVHIQPSAMLPKRPSDIPLDQDQVGSVLPQTIEEFRMTFEARFGSEVSQLLRKKALQAFGSLQVTAQRYLQAIAEGRPFRMGFAGYSITVGRGNFFHQSYPFVLYHILQPLLQNTLGLSLTVKNAAIGGSKFIWSSCFFFSLSVLSCCSCGILNNIFKNSPKFPLWFLHGAFSRH